MPGISESSILLRLRCFVQENPFYRERCLALTDDEKLLKKAGVDSRCTGEMVTVIEEEFGVVVAGFEITEDNLGDLRAVARFVASKQPYTVG